MCIRDSGSCDIGKKTGCPCGKRITLYHPAYHRQKGVDKNGKSGCQDVYKRQHLGDITKIHGGNIPPVHIITFGSPCLLYTSSSLMERHLKIAVIAATRSYQHHGIIQHRIFAIPVHEIFIIGTSEECRERSFHLSLIHI